MADDKEIKEEKKPEVKEGMFDETTSYSFLFFLVSGGLLLVTLWTFWDDEYSRRGYKYYQELFFQKEYDRAEDELKVVSKEVDSKLAQIQTSLQSEEESLNASDDFQSLSDQVLEAQIAYDEVKMDQKFAKSRLDEAYYYYKKALHANENYDVQINNMKGIEKEIADYNPVLEKLAAKRDALEEKLLAKKAKQLTLEKDLKKLKMKKDDLVRRMDFYKPFPFFLQAPAVRQTVITGATLNNFKEIIYKVDRCMTCHIAYNNPHYEDGEQPLRTHPNREILIKKHDPEATGCTWCHKGQGSATAPPEHAHGSHHETDQTVGINEPILLGNQMQSNCRNCHAEVINLEGAPLLSKGKRLFVELGCHGCHLADGYQKEKKVGPSLMKIAAKVNPSWLYRWIKKPREYLPETRMPNFNLSDEDVVSVSAYLMSSSEKGYKLSKKFTSGDKENGKELFESIGCLACHTLEGKGEKFAPDLSRIANKVNADWIVTWLSDQKHYNDKSTMPFLRLKEKEASDIAAYLMEFGKPEHMHGIEAMLKNPDSIAKGEVIVRRRGCFACHDIKGMEKEGRIAPELSAFGNKQVRELEFGDTHIPHTWTSWAKTKLKNPLSYRTERILDKMPNFHLADDEIEALVVLLKGFNGVKIPDKYRKILTDKEQTLERGRRLTTKYNCKGCHVVEGDGGIIQKYVRGKQNYPPPLDMGLYHVGERIKGSWIYSFLKKPTPVRTWLTVKMPTFNLTDEEVGDFTKYFEALASMNTPYEKGVHVKKPKANINLGDEIIGTMDCGNCHDDGEKGIDFSIASSRLRADWIPKWLKNTREMIPWTKMPNHYEKAEDGTFSVANKFSDVQEIEEDIDKQIGFISDYLIAYNTDNGSSGEEEDSEEDTGEEETEEDSGDGEEDDDEYDEEDEE